MKYIPNQTFGKFARNSEKYSCIEIARTPEQLRKFSSSPNFLRQIIMAENLVLVEMTPVKFEYKFQYAVASTILELAKLYMYEFCYDTLLPHFYPDIPQLIMTDKDYSIFNQLFKFMTKFQNLSLMDFSNFPNSHVLHNEE